MDRLNQVIKMVQRGLYVGKKILLYQGLKAINQLTN